MLRAFTFTPACIRSWGGSPRSRAREGLDQEAQGGRLAKVCGFVDRRVALLVRRLEVGPRLTGFLLRHSWWGLRTLV